MGYGIGDPMPGDFRSDCSSCGKAITVDVDIVVTYSARPYEVRRYASGLPPAGAC